MEEDFEAEEEVFEEKGVSEEEDDEDFDEEGDFEEDFEEGGDDEDFEDVEAEGDFAEGRSAVSFSTPPSPSFSAASAAASKESTSMFSVKRSSIETLLALPLPVPASPPTNNPPSAGSARTLASNGPPLVTSLDMPKPLSSDTTHPPAFRFVISFANHNRGATSPPRLCS